MSHAFASRICLLFLFPLLGFAAFAQQIPCPINADYTNTSAIASNQIDCTITATLENASASFLYNVMGGALENYGAINNDGGATLINNAATINNFSGGTISNLENGEIDNAGFLNNNNGGIINNYGTVNNKIGGFATADIDNYGSLNNFGTLHNWDGTINNYDTLNNFGGAFTNDFGTINNSGAIWNYGVLTNDVGGTINNTGALYNVSGLDNFGTLNIQAGSTVSNVGSLFFSAFLTNSGVITIQAGGALVNEQSDPFFNDLINSGTIVNYGMLSSGDPVYNTGTIVIANGGSFGSSAPYYQFDGLTQIDKGGTLNNGYISYLFGGTTVVNGTLENNGVFENGDPNGQYGGGALKIGNGGVFNNAGDYQQYGGAGAMLDNSGTLNNSGTIENYGGALTNSAGGTINNSGTIWNYGLLTNNVGGTINNSGTLYIVGGFDNFGMLNIQAGGMISNAYSFYTGSILNNFGIITIQAGGELANEQSDPYSNGLFNYGTIVNYGFLSNADIMDNTGTVEIASGGSSYSLGPYSQYGGVTQIDKGGAFTISYIYYQGAGTTVVDGTLSSVYFPVQIMGGKLMGTGTIFGDVNMNGTMAPGDSPGALTINGNYTQTHLGTFELEILNGGFDQLNVGGVVSLDGTLNILLAQGFNPVVGTTYQFLLFNSGELNGMFANIQNDIFNNGTEQWFVIYDNAGGFVEVKAGPTPEPASLSLLGSGLVTLGYSVRRRLKK